ncbi:ABC transporter ATP-binding protein [Roseateles cavernae]|uniref:ABC transporter ATP-binding protein n=1 Tax=Roseateles cavernae TaxID=3153578 RepID=UPI0032E3CCAD
MLQATQLSKRFGAHQALDTLTLSIAPGEVFCLLGPNGAGKTTTLNLFLGFLKPTQGDARVDGLDVATDPDGARARLSYLPEQVALYPHLSGLDNLRFFASVSGARTDTPMLQQCLADAGLQCDAFDRRVSGYSKGMRQKVAVALTLLRASKALLLDEPTSGLDPQASREFAGLIGGLRERGLAVLMATHDLIHAKDVATRIGIMKSGRLVAEFASDEVSHQQLQQAYLDQIGGTP